MSCLDILFSLVLTKWQATNSGWLTLTSGFPWTKQTMIPWIQGVIGKCFGKTRGANGMVDMLLLWLVCANGRERFWSYSSLGFDQHIFLQIYTRRKIAWNIIPWRFEIRWFSDVSMGVFFSVPAVKISRVSEFRGIFHPKTLDEFSDQISPFDRNSTFLPPSLVVFFWRIFLISGKSRLVMCLRWCLTDSTMENYIQTTIWGIMFVYFFQPP